MANKKHEITKQDASLFVEYNPETGDFLRKIGNKNYPAGGIAGSINSDGYRQIRVKGVKYMASRLAFLFMDEPMPETVDHVNRDKLDNRFLNLRPVSRSESSRNRKVFSNNTSGERGVNWHKLTGKWQVSVRHEGKLIHFGLFTSKDDAIKKAREVRDHFHGEYAGINKD